MAIIKNTKPMSAPTVKSSITDIDEAIVQFRAEEPIVTILNQTSKITIDDSIVSELRTYRCYNATQEIKYIRGPEDFETLAEIFDKIQRMKDRVCEIQLIYMSILHDVEALKDMATNHLCFKKEIMELKNETQRNAAVYRTISELIEKYDTIKFIIQSTELIVKNLNQTYNIAKEQSVVVQQKMYWRSLTDTSKTVVRD